MQITTRFTIAVHIIIAIDYFNGKEKVTSSFLAESVGVNPVIVREIMGDLKAAGIIAISQGKSGIELVKDTRDITFYDVYKAIGCVDGEGLFHFHERPNPMCPVGGHIHKALDGKLQIIQSEFEDSLKCITLYSVIADTRQAIADDSELLHLS